MNWDVAKLTAKLDELQIRCSRITDPNQKYLLNGDICNLKAILNFAIGKKVYSFTKEEKQFQVLDRPTLDGMVNFLKSVCPVIAKEFRVSGIHSAPIKLSFPHYISNVESDSLIRLFLANFNEELLEIYESYQSENRINLGPKSFENLTCKGKCFPVNTEGKSYIYTQFTHRLNQVSTLLHEIGHAYQYRGITNPKDYQRKLYSVFGEAYPIFIQYCFYDFLQGTKYKNEALMEESYMLDSFFVYMDYHVANLYNIMDVQYLDNNVLGKGGFFQMSRYLELIMSELLAMQWLYLYRQNPSLANEHITYFNDTFGQTSVEDIYNLYGTKTFYQGIISNINDYRRRRNR